MRALIDADMLLYECAAIAEYPKDEPIKSFEFVSSVYENKVAAIMKTVGADECSLYITGPNNFRNDIAVTAPYKGTRVTEKPFHYHNLKAYIMAKPNCIYVEGMEADDAMCIDQRYDQMANSGGVLSKNMSDTVICSRDKDLRMAYGYHYGWECGQQPEFRMTWVDEHSEGIVLAKNRKSIKGTGLPFFYSQLLTGDKVDNIPGLEGCGPVAAWNLLSGVQVDEMFEVVKLAYTVRYPDTWEAQLTEMAQLLHMVDTLDEDGKPVMWRMPDV